MNEKPNLTAMQDATPTWKLNNPSGTKGLIATDKVGDKVWFFDPETRLPRAEMDLRNHHEILISPDRTKAYVTVFGKISGGVSGYFSESGELISVFDLDTMKMMRQISTAPCKGPHGCRIDTHNQMWVIFQETGEIGLIDLNTEKLIAAYDIKRAGKMPPYLELVPSRNKIYVSSKFANIVVFDTGERRVLREITVPVGTEDLAVSPDESRLVIAENSEQALWVIDTRTDEIIQRVALQGAVMSSPRRSRLIRLRFSGDGKYLISGNFAGGTVHIHDAHNLEDQVMIPVGKGPHGMVFTADNKKLIVSNHDCGMATVIDLETKKAVDWFEFGIGIEAFEFY